MANLPYPIDGIAYDSDGTTALDSVFIVCKNVTNNETLTTTTNSLGQFIFDLANLTSGYRIGDEVSIYASRGLYYDEVVWTLSGSSKTQNLTLEHALQTASLYCSVAEVRRFTQVDSSEFSDAAVYDFIKRVTDRIDELTGRTWKGTQTVTDEYYDGDDTDILWLNNTDIKSVSALSIDDNMDGTYTSITTSYVYVYEQGYIVLNRNAEITSFTAGPKSIKLSYTYGNQYPNEAIKEMCLLMVSNLMHYDPQREDMWNRTFERERWSGPGGAS